MTEEAHRHHRRGSPTAPNGAAMIRSALAALALLVFAACGSPSDPVGSAPAATIQAPASQPTSGSVAASETVAGSSLSRTLEAFTARGHPDWSSANGRCEYAMIEAGDSADVLSAQFALSLPDWQAERLLVCMQLSQCQWEETGTPAVEFTVKSRRAYEDCYDLVFSQFD